MRCRGAAGWERDARRGLLIDEVAARVSFTAETAVLPSCALLRGCCGGVSVSAGGGELRFGSHRQPLQNPRSGVRASMRLRRESISRSRRPCSPLKRGVMGTGRRGGGDVQSWVKPEVDPPRIFALPRFLNPGRHPLSSPISRAGITTPRVLHQFA